MILELSFISALLLILFAAAAGRFLSNVIEQPAILGELLVGIILGSFMTFATEGGASHEPLFELFRIAEAGSLFDIADIGVLFLLFSIGLELELERFKNIAVPAAEVAVTGVVLPFLLAYFTAIYFGFPMTVAMFIGASSVATSVGISASILQESGKLRTRVGTLIMGSAVADDVMGILIMTALFGFATTGSLSLFRIGLLVLGTLVFFALSLTLGISFFKKISERFSLGRENLLLLGLLVFLTFSLISEKIGLASLTGAFIGGLILGQTRFSGALSNSISLIGGSFFIPIFFVTMGMKFNVAALASAGLFTVVLILLGVFGKIFSCGASAKLTGFTNRESWATGLAMVPRAEVSLVVINFGFNQGILSSDVVSAVIAMVMVTAFVTPPFLWRVLGGYERSGGS